MSQEDGIREGNFCPLLKSRLSVHHHILKIPVTKEGQKIPGGSVDLAGTYRFSQTLWEGWPESDNVASGKERGELA